MKHFTRTIGLLLLAALCIGMLSSCVTLPYMDWATEGTTDTTGKTDNGSTPPNDPGDDPGDDPGESYPIITIAEALERCGESGNVTDARYYIRGTVASVTDARYGAMIVEDETGSISVYGTYSADGSVGYADMTEKPYKGDTVILHCILQNYNGTKEVKDARLIKLIPADNAIDESAYTEMTVAEARDAAADAKVKVDGVVAAITYSNGQKPAGVYLVDETQSIYVYDVDLASRVTVGTRIVILATKTYWILEKEQENAAKFGYRGCCQLEDVTLVEQAAGTGDFDKSWIPESTVKDILDTPVSENITTSLYRVNALVSKVPGSGFVNYYINDLDGTTGSYVYTQCNGADFSWLDEFDGKICTVYLSVINAKSSASECFFRFLPVAVADEGFVFDSAEAPAHAVKYYGLPQIGTSYTGDPALELVTSVSSTLLGFEGVTLSYASDNESVVWFAAEGDQVTLHCGDAGTATVTVTASHGGNTHSATVTVKVEENITYETITVAEAIATAPDEIVTVRGIVGPSVVNKSGFYLFDESGMIAVLVDASVFEGIEIGHEIVLRGRRECYKDAGKTHAGQTCIVEGEVLANYYGTHDYPTDDFITGKTLKDLYDLDATVDYTTNVYVVTATVSVSGDDYYTNIVLNDGTSKFNLYCSSAKQYDFLQAFAGEEVTMEIAVCNWNNKNYYRGCVLAVYTEDGKVLNELNFNV